MTPTHRLATVAASAALLVTLSACSGGEQSVEAACKLVNESPITTGGGALEEAMSEALENAGTLADAYQPLLDELKSLGNAVSNSEVAGLLDNTHSTISAVVDAAGDLTFPDLEAVAQGDPEAVKQYEELEAQLAEAEEQLTDEATEMEDTLLQLASLCGTN